MVNCFLSWDKRIGATVPRIDSHLDGASELFDDIDWVPIRDRKLTKYSTNMAGWGLIESTEMLEKMQGQNSKSGWWFGIFFIFPYIGNYHPNWLNLTFICFRGVGLNHQPENLGIMEIEWVFEWKTPQPWKLELALGKSPTGQSWAPAQSRRASRLLIMFPEGKNRVFIRIG